MRFPHHYWAVLSTPSVYFDEECLYLCLYIISLILILRNWVCDNWVYQFAPDYHLSWNLYVSNSQEVGSCDHSWVDGLCTSQKKCSCIDCWNGKTGGEQRPHIYIYIYRERDLCPDDILSIIGQCPSTVRPVFPMLVFQLSKQQDRTRTTSSTVLGTPPSRTRTNNSV